MVKWNPMKTAPRDGTEIHLINFDKNGEQAYCVFEKGEWKITNAWLNARDRVIFKNPSAWLPLS